jgi:hypothetical protein
MARARTATITEPLSDLDREALERALAIDRKRDAACRQQIEERLGAEPWFEVARLAAQRCQETSLHLRPWECWPPCAVAVDDVDEPGYEHRGIRQSAELLRRMLAIGLSRFEPDPESALRRAEGKGRGAD